MTRGQAGRLFGAVLFLPALAMAEPVLEVRLPSGVLLGALSMPAASEICLHWAHSVTGGAVADCFENRDGRLTLTRSYLHDFAAGLGEVPGRGRLVSAPQGGYWITDIGEPLPNNRLDLRVGSARVGHRLETEDSALDLSSIAPRQRVNVDLVSRSSD
jgi:hypothetical protein